MLVISAIRNLVGRQLQWNLNGKSGSLLYKSIQTFKRNHIGKKQRKLSGAAARTLIERKIRDIKYMKSKVIGVVKNNRNHNGDTRQR